MSAADVVSHTVDADGVGWMIFDDPELRANVFNTAMQDALVAALDRAAGDVDFALLSGAGFPAFHGGLLRWPRQMRLDLGPQTIVL